MPKGMRFLAHHVPARDASPAAIAFPRLADATVRPPPPRHPDRGRVRPPQRQDRLWRHPLRPRRRRRRPRLDPGRARTSTEFLPGHDIPIVATLDEALALPSPPDALLIGIAPTGGRLPAAWRTIILAAIAAGLDVLSGLHTFLGDDPEFAAAAAARGTRIVDYRRPPDRMETAVGRRHAPGKRVILTVGTDCAIGKMSVALELRRAALEAGRPRLVRADRADRDDDRGLGRGGRPADQRLRPGHRRVDGRAGRGARGLGHRRGPGLARPPGLLVGDAGAHPRRDAAGDGHGPQARPRRATTSTTCPRRSFPIAELPRFIALHERVAGLVAPSKVVAVALNTSLYPRRSRCSPDHRGDRRPRPGCRPTTRSGSARSGSGRRSARRSTPCRGSPRVSLHVTPRGPATSRCATRSASPGPTTTRTRASRRSSSSCVTTGSRASSGWGRATRTGSTARRPTTMAAVFPHAPRRGRRVRDPTPTGLAAAERSRWSRVDPLDTEPPSAPSTSRSTTSSARSSGSRSTSCSGCPRRHPADRLHDRIDEPAVVAERAARAAASRR